MDEKDTTKKNEAGTNHGGGVLSRDAAYRKTAAYFDRALQVLVDKLDSRNDAVALGAANKIIDKCLPDIKAVELTGENGEPIKLNIISGADYLSTIRELTSSSSGGTAYGSTAIQSPDLAPQSEKDNDSNKPVSEVEST